MPSWAARLRRAAAALAAAGAVGLVASMLAAGTGVPSAGAATASTGPVATVPQTSPATSPATSPVTSPATSPTVATTTPQVATTAPRSYPTYSTRTTYYYSPSRTSPTSYQTTTSTTVAPTTTSTVVPLPGNVNTTPSTLPLTTKKQSGHVDPVFAELSGVGFVLALVLLGAQALLTRRSRDSWTL